MIASLVLKDVLLVRYRLLISVGVIALVLSMTDGRPRSAAVVGAIAVHMMTSVLFMQAGSVEEKSRGDLLLHLLPLSRRQIVAGRYAFLLAAATAFAAVYLAMLGVAGGMSMAPVDWLKTAGQCVTLTMAIWSVGLPLVVAYGVTRTQGLLSLGMMLLPGVWLALVRSLTRSSGQWDVLVRAAASPWALVAVLSLAMASYLVSARLYERRDF